ncbi:hypothetical protein FGO68_gene14773 [Halteria grandinella]|uniref:Uncharacterized protein n=1 Tax=Halteria grandinella TaxID=5974 RepID=A0A8J8P5J3_HALGN|nr:hypothetical protein FGO68_gene14773 [Halteria grandinella]
MDEDIEDTTGYFSIYSGLSITYYQNQQYPFYFSWLQSIDWLTYDFQVMSKSNWCQTDRDGLFKQLYPNPSQLTYDYYLNQGDMVIPYNEFSMDQWGTNDF